MFSCVSRGLKSPEELWGGSERISISYSCLRAWVSCEPRHREPKLHSSSLCWVGGCSDLGEVWGRNSFRVPVLFSLRLLLIAWHNCCSIAVMPPWPLCISMEKILGHDHMWKCMNMQGLRSDRGLTLCISWKDYLYYLSTGSGQLKCFMMMLNPRNRYQLLEISLVKENAFTLF